jgi:hypothetical protein
MYHKVRNTLVAATVAMAMLGAGYGVGNPPSEFHDGLDIASQADAGSTAEAKAHKRMRGVQRHMAMPYFSFAPLLPKQGG